MSQIIWVNNNGEWKQSESNGRDLWTTLTDKELEIISGKKWTDQFVDTRTSQSPDKLRKAYAE